MISGIRKSTKLGIPPQLLLLLTCQVIFFAVGCGSSSGGADQHIPRILTEPADQNVNAGQAASFSVAADGTPPLSYQWEKNGTAIAGATASSYTTTTTTAADNGSNFRVVVTNHAGSASSRNATLTVTQAPPTISSQPADQTVNAGQTATFSVAANGTPPLSYQWEKNGTAIAGATASSYTTPATTAADNGSTFRVLVANNSGNVASRNATLTIGSTPVSDYTWKQLKTGAGGFITGMFVHPDGSLVYARTDTGGAYRLNQTTSSWIQIVTTDSLPASDVALGQYGGVVSLVGAPSDHSRAYMAACLGRNNTNVYLSMDQGAHWTKTALNGLNDDANGNGRQMGERLAVDPANADVVYYGSMSNGLFVTSDAGAHWQQVTMVPSSGETSYGTGNVLFDTSGGTTDGRTKVIVATVYKKGVFRSADGGARWQKITGGAGAPLDDSVFQHIAIGTDGTLYLANWGGGTWKYKDSVWTNITPQGGPSLGGIAVDPRNSNRLFAFDSGGTAYRSLDAGSTWTRLEKSRNAADVPWLAFADEDYMSLGTVVFDPQISDRLWFAEGIGVWFADNNTGATITWKSINAGIEQLVPNGIVAPPGGKPVTASWDRALFYHSDVDEYPTSHGPTKRFNAGWDIAYSAANPRFLVASVYDNRQCCSQYGGGPDNQSGYSTDGGQNWTVFAPIANGTLPSELRFGNIAVAASDTQNIVWLPTNNASPYYTKDRGQTWHKIALPGANVPGSHSAYYLHRQVLTADTVQDHTFYLFHDGTNQIFKTTDGGVTWSPITVSNFPQYPQFNAKLKAVPGRSGHLCFTTGLLDGGSRGLFCSEDSGSTWAELSGTSDISAFGYGRPFSESHYATIFVQGQLNGEAGIWCTTDKGMTWGKLTSYPLGIPDSVSAMDGDRDVFGRLYIGFGGSGFAYGDPGPNPPATLCRAGQ